MPIEVLGEIFLRCLPPPAAPDAEARASTSSAPLLFLFVCKRWSRIATSLPALWTKLVIHNSQKMGDIMCPGPNAWVSRARNLPLSVSLTLTGPKCDLLLQLLLPNIGQIQTLSLFMPREFYSVFKRLPTGAARRLEAVAFGTPYSDPRISRRLYIDRSPSATSPQAILQTPFLDLASFSALRSVSIRTNNAHSSLIKDATVTTYPVLIRIPWSTLTTISIHEPTLNELKLQALLLLCRSVVSCSILLIATSQLHTPLPKATLPNLKTLRIEYNSNPAIQNTGRLAVFLKPFVLPALRELEIKSPSVIKDMPAMALRDLYRRWPTPLAKLTISGIQFGLTNTMQLFGALPETTSLQLEPTLLPGLESGQPPFHVLHALITNRKQHPSCAEVLTQLILIHAIGEAPGYTEEEENCIADNLNIPV
jgi:hypothetical protein